MINSIHSNLNSLFCLHDISYSEKTISTSILQDNIQSKIKKEDV